MLRVRQVTVSSAKNISSESAEAEAVKSLSGRIQTVLGPVDCDKLGVVLTHEHIFLDSSKAFFHEPDDEKARSFAYEPVRIENLWWLRSHRTDSLDNLRLVDYDVAKDEVQLFKDHGGGSIVEVTVEGISLNPHALKNLSLETGVNIIAATGYYISPSQPPELASLTVEQLASRMKKNIYSGFGDTGIKAGIIKVALTHNPKTIEINEEKVLRAASMLQQETGAPMTIHPPRPVDHEHPRSWWALKLINVLQKYGVDLNKVVFCHMDTRTYEKVEYLKKITESGAYIEFDDWGAEWPFCIDEYGENGPFPSDYQRILMVKDLVGSRCLDRLVFSHDVWIKMLLTKYGGYGYAHILRDIVPWLRKEGLTQKVIDTILIRNPQRLLTFK